MGASALVILFYGLGGGGGGTGQDLTDGGDGGDGVVIIRYLI